MIRYKNILYIILGVFLIQAFGSVNTLIFGLLKFLEIPLMSRMVFSTVFEALIILGLLYFLFLVFKDFGNDRKDKFIDLSLQQLRVYGLIILLIIIIGRVLNYFYLKDLGAEMESENGNFQYDSINLQIAISSMSILKEIILFIIFFVIVFKQRIEKSTTTNNGEHS